ncbi:hypothetical protein H5T51_04290 [Candidatus Bathyarchaeota archaeon]|nr:hypothetical protein [Candidatus Bathyarchaeota archaeon]
MGVYEKDRGYQIQPKCESITPITFSERIYVASRIYELAGAEDSTNNAQLSTPTIEPPK